MSRETKIIFVGSMLLLAFIMVLTLTTTKTRADWKQPGVEYCYFCISDCNHCSNQPNCEAYIRCECWVGSQGCPSSHTDPGCHNCTLMGCGCGDPGGQ